MYAREALADPAVQALYYARSREVGSSPTAVAVADFFKPPVIRRVDLDDYHGRVNDFIDVLVDDGFEVRSVRVELLNNVNAVLDSGDAVFTLGKWRFTAKAAIPAGQVLNVISTAMDRPVDAGRGQAAEEGEAVKLGGGVWHYRPRMTLQSGQAVTITVRAVDRAGNETTREETVVPAE